MNDHPLTHILNQLAAEGASADLDLRFAVHQRLETSKTHSPKGVFSMKTSFAHPRRLAATIAIVIILLAVSFLLTPQGRAWAQEFFYFFKHAESDTLPLQPWQMTAIAHEYEETQTPMIETPTLDPNSGYVFDLSIAEAGQEAGFSVMVPAWVPEALSFSGASYQPEHNIVRLFYTHTQFPDISAGLVLREELFQTVDDCSLCGVVGASEQIETVTIGDTVGEYVVGVWILTDNGPVWESTSLLKTLRWQRNGLAFELMYMGISDSISEVSKADLIAIAESMK